ncbi:MAG: surface protein [Flavipsychrobacter sp.]|nr:surface protein [Flavipsychrobacter sp.]
MSKKYRIGMRKALLFIILLLCGVSYSGYATITVTAASAAICTNYASTGSAPRFTTLGTMTVKEGASADLGSVSGSWSVVLTLTAPTGWQYNSAVLPTLSYTISKNITSITRGTFSSSSLTITVSGSGKGRVDVFTISGLRVQPTSTSAATGNIKPSYISGTTKTITTSTNFGTLSRTTASSGTASISISASPSGTICSGTNVTFTATPVNGGTAPSYQWKLNGVNISGATASTYSSTGLANGNAITCALVSNSCITSPTATSAAITMSVNPTPNVSNFTGTSASAACINGSSTITINSTSLGVGTFTVTYDLSGVNTSANNTATLTTGSSSGTFTATGFPNSGSTTITVTDITSSAGCNAVVSGSNTAAFTVNTLPAAVTATGSGTYCGSATITASNGGSGTIYYESTTSLGTSTVTPSSSQSVSSTGNYYFRAQSSAGCWGNEDTVSVVINPLPSAITGTATVCAGLTTALTDAGGGTWSTSNANASVGLATGIVTGNTAGTTVVTYTLSTGCIATTVVTVNPTPAAITGAKYVCAGATIALSDATASGTWTSGSTAVATINSSALVTGVTTGTSVVSYTLSTGCAVNTTVTVSTTPGAIGGSSAVCSGLTITLTDAVPYGTWSSSNTTVAAVGSNTGVVTGGSNGTATITYSTGCSTPVTKTITVGNSPIGGNLSICTSGTTTLTDALPGGTWTSASTAIATVGSSSGVVTGVSGGTVLISYTNGLCASTATVTVNIAPTAIGGTASVCTGLTTTLTDAVPYGTWSSNNTTVATVGLTTGLVSGLTAGTANISYATGCGTAVAKTVTVNALPSSIIGTMSVCSGLTTALTDAGGGTWTSSNTTVATVVSSTGVVTGAASGTATITYTLSTGCIATTIVTVNPLPSAISGTKTVCAGLTTTLSDVGGGIWSSGSTAIAAIGTSNGVATGVAAGTTTITYILATGCIAMTVITVNPLPAAISGTTSVCVSSTTTLSDAGGGTWSSTSTGIATINSLTGVTSGIAAGTSRITYALSTGCIITTTVTVNPLPSAISGTPVVCPGATTTLSDAGGGTWTSSNTAIATIGSGSGIATGVSAGTSVISYSLSTGCKRGTTLIVDPLPTPGVIAGPTSVCEADFITLSSVTTGGTWVSSDTNAAVIDSLTGDVSGENAGTVTITYTITNSCGDTTSTYGVTVNPLPDAGSISGNTDVCNGSTTTLTNTSAGGTWTSDNTAIATVGSSTGVVTGVAAGTVTMTYEVANGCGVDENDTDITVLALPSAISGTKTVCAGSATTLSDAEGGTWSSSNTAIATIGTSSGIVTGVAAGTATITYTLSTGCNVTTVVTVNPSPAAISGTKLVCVGLTTTLSDAGGGTWSSSTTTIATIGSSTGIATGVAAGTSTITYKIGTGCAVTIILTVSALPSAISGTTTVCTGAATTLNNTGGGTWSTANTAIATVGSGSGIVTSVSVGTAVITYTLPAGCLTTTTVTVKAAPSLASATNSGPVCAGVTLTLTANTPSNVTAYSWSGPVTITSGGTTATATVSTVTTTASGTYTVTVSNGSGAGCSVNYTTAATVNVTPTAAPTNNSPICTGGTVTLTANPGGSANRYVWSGSNLSSTTAQNPTATPTVTATYSLTVTYNTGLSGCSPTTVYTTTVTVSSVPTAAPTNNGPKCSGGTVTLTANPGGSANQYIWSGPNLSSTTAQNPTATATVTATYSLSVTYGTGNPGCSSSTVYTTTVSVTPKGYWQGTTNTDWATSGNWCGGVPAITTDVVIPGGLANYPVLSSGIGYAKNLTLNSSTTLTVTSSTLQIAGAISNSGTFAATAGTIEMNGSSAQTIPANVFASNKINNLTINNSAGVTINGTLQVAGIVKATSGNLTTGGYLTLLSTATQTALIDGSGSGDVLGNVTMQCYLDTGYGYKYISSPFKAATLGGLSPYINFTDTFPTFYRYDENVQSAGWFTDTTKTDTLKVLRGYAGNFGSSLAAKTIALTGVVNNGSLSFAIYNHNDTFTRGFNLVGNPYPSPINWTAASGWTKTNVDNAVYYFNTSDTNQYTGTYSSYISGISSDGIASNIIPAMQGFFVHVSNGSFPVTGSLGTTNAVRVTNLSPGFHKTTATDRPLIRLEAGYVNDPKHKDPVVIYYDDMAVNEFDKERDAVKLLNTDYNTPNLYTLLNTNTKLAIQAMPLPATDSTQIVPLGLQIEKDGPVTFNLRTMEYLPAGMHVYLYDVKTGKVQDMGADANYSTSIAKGRYDNRFFLMFTNKERNEIPVINSGLNAYSSGGKLFVYLVNGEGDVVVNNIIGQVIWKEHITSNGFHEINYKFNTGVYITTMLSNMGRQSKKLFIGKE